MIEFINPTLELESEWNSLIKEFLDCNEKIVPFGIYWDGLSYQDLVRRIEDVRNGRNIPEGKVASTTYFVRDIKSGKIVGATDIRIVLNDYLNEFGGNIGHGVRPSERNKGYATKMFAAALQICKEASLDNIWVVCNQDNIASKKVISKFHGILEKTFIENGKVRERYQIKL